MRKNTKRRGRPATKQPHPVDVYVGQRVRLRRTLLGLSQGRLGDQLGLTFQQVQKYERGANRIAASRLKQMADALDVPIGFFFDGFDDADDLREPAVDRQLVELAKRLAAFDQPQRAALLRAATVFGREQPAGRK